MAYAIQVSEVKSSGNGRMDTRLGKARLVKPSLRYDSYVQRLTDTPTPEKLVALLMSAEHGEIWKLVQLQMEMEAKSAQFRGLCDVRRDAVRCLDWAIEPSQDLVDDALANEVADYCTATLVNMRGLDPDNPPWDTALAHLSTAIGANVAAIEKIWEKGELVDLVCVPHTRLRSGPITNQGIAIETDEFPMGIPTSELPGKFVVYHHEYNGGFPFRRTLTHASVLPYIFIHFSQADWSAFNELFGHPIRHGQSPLALDSDDRLTLEEMLTEMGSDTAAMFPTGTEIGYLQAQGTGETFQKALDYADTKLTILWRGEVQTTDGGDGGSFAKAKTQKKVSESKMKGDIAAEARCIRHQILRPMVEMKYPGRNAPVPYFVRKVEEGRDIEGEKLNLEKLRFARESAIRLDEDVIYENLGLPKPETAAPKDEGHEQVTITFNELTLGIERSTALGDLDLVNALRSQIARMLGVSMPVLTELPQAVSPGVGDPKNPNAKPGGKADDEDEQADA